MYRYWHQYSEHVGSDAESKRVATEWGNGVTTVFSFVLS